MSDLGPLNSEPKNVRPPFDEWPPVGPVAPSTSWILGRRAETRAALVEAIGPDVELGVYDNRILDWLAGWDTSVIGTVASLFYRVRAAALAPVSDPVPAVSEQEATD